MDLAPGGQLLLTFLSPVYCPNQKLLKKKKNPKCCGGLASCRFLWERERIVGKGLNINTLPWKVSSTLLMEPKCKPWQELHISS